MTWLDFAIGVIITIGGLFIFYRALKEPADQMFAIIGNGIKGVINMFKGGGSDYYEEIRYG